MGTVRHRVPPKASTSGADAIQGVIEPTRRISCYERYSEALRKRVKYPGLFPLPPPVAPIG